MKSKPTALTSATDIAQKFDISLLFLFLSFYNHAVVGLRFDMPK